MGRQKDISLASAIAQAWITAEAAAAFSLAILLHEQLVHDEGHGLTRTALPSVNAHTYKECSGWPVPAHQ